MEFRYPTAFRESACKRMLAGERADDLANELEVSAATLYRWKKQSLIDAGRRPGLKSYEPDEMARARWQDQGARSMPQSADGVRTGCKGYLE
jgi:putative transposase